MSALLPKLRGSDFLVQGESEFRGTIGPSAREERITIDQLLDELIVHLENKGAKTVVRLKSHLKPLREFFAFVRAINVATADVERYIAQRLAARKARATVNRETGALKQAFNLARKQGRLARVPYIPMLREDNARQGFFEHVDFLNVVKNLPDPIKDIASFAYLCGWRKGEVLSLRWEAVDRGAREVRLRTSKNGEGRLLPLAGELWDVIERRWAARRIEMKDGTVKLSEFVFHRSGDPIVDFRDPGTEACKKAAVPGKLFHDLRRTAVCNMVRAGVGQAVAMTISGHKTASMFQRYNVTSSSDQREALDKTAAHLAAQPAVPQNQPTVNPVAIRQAPSGNADRTRTVHTLHPSEHRAEAVNS